jgi:hypothetical protein
MALGAGKCGRCQAEVVEDAASFHIGSPLPTRDEFEERLRDYEAAYHRQIGPYFRILPLCFLPGVLAVGRSLHMWNPFCGLQGAGAGGPVILRHDGVTVSCLLVII